VEIFVRHAEPEDYEAIHGIYLGPRAVAGTLQLPFQSLEYVRTGAFRNHPRVSTT
jgi:hypothetical protein